MSGSLRRIHWLLGVQTIVILLGSLNRLGPWTLGYVAANPCWFIMRWPMAWGWWVRPFIE